MSEELVRTIDDEFLEDCKHLKSIDVGSAEFKTTIEGLDKLVGMRCKLTELELEREERERKFQIETELKERELAEKIAAREAETEIKLAHLEEQRASREEEKVHRKATLKSEFWKWFVPLAVTGVMTIGGKVFSHYWLERVMRYEETGYLSNRHGNRLIDKATKDI